MHYDEKHIQWHVDFIIVKFHYSNYFIIKGFHFFFSLFQKRTKLEEIKNFHGCRFSLVYLCHVTDVAISPCMCSSYRLFQHHCTAKLQLHYLRVQCHWFHVQQLFLLHRWLQLYNHKWLCLPVPPVRCLPDMHNRYMYGLHLVLRKSIPWLLKLHMANLSQLCSVCGCWVVYLFNYVAKVFVIWWHSAQF